MSLTVGIIQSNYLPWRGYFDFIASVDLFIVYDDVQYTQSDWRNRNKIKTAQGTKWITVPVSYGKTAQLICDSRIDDRKNWHEDHLNIIKSHYQKAPFLPDVLTLLGPQRDSSELTISQLNVRLLKSICTYLGIKTPFLKSSDLNVQGYRTDRLVEILQKVNATAYLSGAAADSYLEKEKFREAGISLHYKDYTYQPYPQLWGDFEGGVSIIDLIANCGPDSARLIRSEAPNTIIIA